MKMKTKKVTYWVSVVIIGAAIGLALQFAKAWTESTANPPATNVEAPINTGKNDQTKIGGITAGYLSAPIICLNGNCRSSWMTFGTCSCGTCWNTELYKQSVTTANNCCGLCDQNGYWRMCTPSGWVQMGASICTHTRTTGCISADAVECGGSGPVDWPSF